MQYTAIYLLLCSMPRHLDTFASNPQGSLLGYFADCAACSVARFGRGSAARRRSADHRFLPSRNQVTSSPMPLTGIGPRRWNR
jgi:hypothetical protein